MAHGSRDQKAACSGQDFISGLPDGVLQHVLGYLPAVEAVRTCVLGRRWRHMWKSTRRLHITKPGDRRALNDFVNPLLLLRDRRSTLDEVKFDYDPRIVDHIDVWVRHALLCQAQVLVAHFPGENQAILKGPPLDSQHLRKLQLTGPLLEYMPSLETAFVEPAEIAENYCWRGP
ncbi:hypothetical protein ACP70R_003793 [Stipagrostis hirtigluma subsp. patula]